MTSGSPAVAHTSADLTAVGRADPDPGRLHRLLDAAPGDVLAALSRLVDYPGEDPS